MSNEPSAAPGFHLSNLVKSNIGKSSLHLLRDHVPSKELLEAESILNNIRMSLQSLNEPHLYTIRDSQVNQALKVDEQDKESSSDTSGSE
jgi:hypothetical protein